MFISVKRDLIKNCLIYAIATAFTAVFGAVYEHFSHEVYSNYMLYAFAIPLVLGLIPLLCIALSEKNIPVGWGMRIYNSGVAALTVGSLFKGVLEIYGTTNKLIIVYLIAGIALIFVGFVISIIQMIMKK